jgi:trimeric autotransporter adhesin
MTKRLIIITGSLAAVLTLAVGVWAYLTTTGSGTASGSVGTLTAPGKPNVPTTGATVNLSWSAAAVTGGGTVAYHVERRADPGSTWTDVCGSSDTVPITATSCNDTPGGGAFVYRVTARYASWHTAGPESDPVTPAAADTTPPYVTAINLADANPTNASTLHWTVTFSESVTGVDTTDFAFAASVGVSGGSISSVTGSGSGPYTVTAGGVSGNGTLGLNLVDNNSIGDGASNPLGGSGGGANGDFTGQVYTVDQTAPTVTVNQKAGQADPTNTLPIQWTVTFSEPVTGFDQSDLTRGGTTTGGSFAVTGGPSVFTISVTNPGSNLTNGTTSFTVAASKAQDLAGNNNMASTSTDNTVTYDTVSPTVTVSQKAGQADPTNALPILYTVTFSESVTGFDATDLTRSGTSTGGTAGVTGSGASYEIAVTGTPTDGTISFSIAANKAVDAAGNNNTASASTDNTVT